MNAIIALARKDLLLLLRDRVNLFWIFAFPIMFALFFGAIFSSSGDEARGGLSLIIVDESQSPESRRLIELLSEHASVNLDRQSTEAEPNEDSSPPPVELYSIEDAREAVQKGRRAAYLRIPKGFGENPYALFSGQTEDAKLEIGIDPRRSAEAGFLQGVLMGASFASIQERFLDKDLIGQDLSNIGSEVASSDDFDGTQKVVIQAFLSAIGLFVDQLELGGDQTEGDASSSSGIQAQIEIVDVTRQSERAPRSAYDITFPQALVWGLMSVAMSFAITLVRERTTGTLVRLRMAPIGRAQLLAGKALACFTASMLTMLLILGFGWLALGVKFDSFPLLLLGMTATSICFTGIMLTISVMGKTEPAVAGSSWGLMMPFAMIGGGMIPLMAMPGWLVQVSAVSPFKWAITAIEGAIWRDFNIGDMLMPCAILVGIGMVFATIGISVFRKIDD